MSVLLAAFSIFSENKKPVGLLYAEDETEAIYSIDHQSGNHKTERYVHVIGNVFVGSRRGWGLRKGACDLCQT